MKIQLIRNATMKMEYAGKKLLLDPMLGKKGTIRSFAGIEPNPTIELSLDMKEIISELDAVLLSHLHPDHFDEAAEKLLDKNLKILCPEDCTSDLNNKGFSKTLSIKNEIDFEEINIKRINGQHGKGLILKKMGDVSAFILSAENEPTVFWLGDTILTKNLKATLLDIKPDVVITHSGGAKVLKVNRIIMNDKETIEVAKLLPSAKIIAVHMEALDHCPVTREQLRKLAVRNSVSEEQLLIPNDGEIISF